MIKKLCNIPINNQHCHAKHRNYVGKISTPFRIRNKKIVNFKHKDPLKYQFITRDRLNKLLVELEKFNTIKQIGSTPDEKHTIGTTF